MCLWWFWGFCFWRFVRPRWRVFLVGQDGQDGQDGQGELVVSSEELGIFAISESRAKLAWAMPRVAKITTGGSS